jgi:DnaJ-domain-containing protein 1
MAANNDMNAWRRQNSEPTPVEISLTDGTSFKGTLLVQRDKHLRDIINGPEQFIELETLHAGQVTIAKSAIKLVRPGLIGAADQLEKKLAAIEKSDSFAVLGLPQNADMAAVRNAFVKLAHMYHPDRYVTAELPAEVIAYLNIMIRRINAAHQELRELLEFEGKQSASEAAAA